MTRSEDAALATTIDERLRIACDWEKRVYSFQPGVDISPAAITARIRDCTDLSSLCLELAPVDHVP